MTLSELEKDIDYIKTMAESGAQAPLIGGKIGLLWGILITIILLFQWSVLTKTFNLPPQSLFYAWLSFAVLGALGSYLLSRKLPQVAGANSVANRVDQFVWTMFSAMMVCLFIGVLLNVTLSSGDYSLYNIIIPIAFAGQGLAYGLIAKISHMKWLGFAALLNFVFSIFCFVIYTSANVYLIAALGIVITVIIPSLLTIRQEADDVV